MAVRLVTLDGTSSAVACSPVMEIGNGVVVTPYLKARTDRIAKEIPEQPIERRRPVQPAARKINPPGNT